MTERKPKTCPYCYGEGLVYATPVGEGRIVYDCPKCEGWGWVSGDGEEEPKR